MKSPTPLVSVITPTFNRADLLRETVESVLNQNYPRVEYLVLDDGSTDSTASLMARYGDRVRYLTHDNRGEAGTVNRGFSEASGDMIAVVNSDDPVRPGFLSTMVRVLNDHPEAVVAYPDWEIIDAEGHVVELRQTADHDFALMVAANWCYVGPGAVMRRRLIERIGGRNPAYRQVGDLDFWLRAGMEGPFLHVPRPLATWRTHPGSTSISDTSDAKVAEYVTVMKAFFARADLPEELRALEAEALSMAHHIAALKSMWHRRNLARRYLMRSLALRPSLRSRHPSHPRSIKIMLRVFLLPQSVDRLLLRRWMLLRYGEEPDF